MFGHQVQSLLVETQILRQTTKLTVLLPTTGVSVVEHLDIRVALFPLDDLLDLLFDICTGHGHIVWIHQALIVLHLFPVPLYILSAVACFQVFKKLLILPHLCFLLFLQLKFCHALIVFLDFHDLMGVWFLSKILFDASLSKLKGVWRGSEIQRNYSDPIAAKSFRISSLWLCR